MKFFKLVNVDNSIIFFIFVNEGAEMIGERIKQARLANGLTLDELAKKMELAGHPITKAALSKYELSKSVPGAKFLITLGKTLGIRPSYFQESPDVEVQWIAFRKRSKMPVKKQEHVQAYALQAVERQLWLQGLLYPSLRPILPPPRKASKLEDAEAAASELRKVWNLDDCPIDSLTSTMEDHGGVVVACDDISPEFDGLSGVTNTGFPVAVVSMGAPDDRRRYNLAHEIGHLLLTFKPGDETFGEQLANRFASALLVPRDIALAELGSKRRRLDFRELGLLKKKHGLSIQGWVRRARDLDIIEESQYKNLCITISSNNWKKSEPVEFHGQETPSRLKQMVLRAVSEGIISAARAEQLIPGFEHSMFPLEGYRPLTPTEIRRLPREARDALLSAAADKAAGDYLNNRDLTSFEAYGEDDLYVGDTEPQKG